MFFFFKCKRYFLFSVSIQELRLCTECNIKIFSSSMISWIVNWQLCIRTRWFVLISLLLPSYFYFSQESHISFPYDDILFSESRAFTGWVTLTATDYQGSQRNFTEFEGLYRFLFFSPLNNTKRVIMSMGWICRLCSKFLSMLIN